MRPLLFLLLLLTGGTLAARAEGPDEVYIRIYGAMQTAEALEKTGQPTDALTKYLKAQTELQKFQKTYPDWNPKIVNFRLNYLASKIARVTSSAATTPATAETRPFVPTPAPAPTLTPSPMPKPPATSAPEWERQLAALQEDVQRLQADKSVLEAKLKEALAAQPAATDPAEFAKVRQQIQELRKENELLKAAVEQPKPGATETKALEEARRALAEANRKLTQQTERSDTLAAEKQALQGRVESLARSSSEAGRLAEVRKALEEANRKLASESETTRRLSGEKEALQSQVRTLTTNANAAEALRQENEVLKKQLADSRRAPATPDADTARKLAETQARIATLQNDAEILRLEKIALEARVKTMSRQGAITAPPAPAAAPVVVAPASAAPVSLPADKVRIKSLEGERTELAKKLEVANKELQSRKGRAASAKVEELNSQITTLRARLEVFEARAVPYTIEELALFKKPATQLASANPAVARKPISSLPSGTASLVASAQRHFAAKEFDQAEQDYLQILQRDENNAYTLANLAAIQLERGRLDEAEQNVRKALATVTDDAYSLSILGYVKFRQEKYDEALDALSRAAKLNPQSAEIQNYLGVTLSHKGLRGPAETALRKAITLDPGYAAAHNNLAVIYLTQNPPSVELARWHYQKALAAGHPKNEELEKSLNEKAAAPAP